MPSLDSFYSSDLVGFFSYSRDDDKGSKGALSALRDAIQWELSGQLGRSQATFRIWQDKAAIPLGTYWENEITKGISQSAFFIPIITPRVFKSENCAFEFKAFLAREQELGRADLVFPLLYIPVPELDDERIWRNDPVLKIVATRQYFDWRDYRPRDLGETEVRIKLIHFCRGISNALRQPWQPPEGRPQRQQDESKPVVERDRQRQTAAMDSARSAEEQKRRDEPEAGRGAEDAERRKAARAKARRAEERREKAAAARLAEEELKKAAAARLAEEELKKAAAARLAEEELKKAVGAAQLAEEERKTVAETDAVRLADDRRVNAAAAEPMRLPKRPSSRAAMRAGGALAAALLIGALVWLESEPSPPSPSQATITVATSSVAPPGSAAASNHAPALPAALGGAPSLNLDKWAACRPASTQKPELIGGPLQPVTLKLTVTPKQLRSIAISPDNTRIVTAGDDGVIRVWDAASLKWIREIHGHTKPVYSVAFSADGTMLASASLDGTVRIWDGQTFAPVQTFSAVDDKGQVAQYGVAFEPVSNPEYVDSVGGDGNVWIWDVHKHALAKKMPSHTGLGVATAGSLSFAPAPNDSGTFATANWDGTIRFFDTGRTDTIPAFPGKALRLAYSPDGKWVASAGADTSVNSMGVKLWNSATHALFRAIPAHRGHAASVAWSRDGTRLASGGGFRDTSVSLWDPQSGNLLKVFIGHTADVEAVAFHPNGKWLVSASEDGTMKLWDIASASELLSVAGFDNGQYLAYAPNGCYTGSAGASSYVKYVTKDAQGRERDVGDNGKDSLFVPADSTALLLPQ